MRRVLRTHRSILFAVPLIALLGGLGYALPAAARIPLMHTPTTYCVKWKGVSSPNVASDDNYLEGVAALSDQDVWAVGYVVTASYTEQGLIEHYNGTSWNNVPNPTPAPLISELLGVATISSADAWAVGYYANAGQYNQPLIEHWDGTSWHTVSSPNIASEGASFSAVAAVSATDVWAVGNLLNSSTKETQTLIEHWNGTNWSIIPSPNVSPTSYGDYLTALAVISDNDIWVAGTNTTISNADQTLLMHWNGSAWSIVPSPNADSSSASNDLSSIAALSSTDVWAVGSYMYDSGNGYDATLAEHWDGSAWSIVSSPNEGISTSLNGITAVSGTNQLWAVGDYFDSLNQPTETLTQRWDGKQWSIISSPNISGASGNVLLSVTSLSMNDQWAVGWFRIPGAHSSTLTEHRALASSPTGACPNY
ncbi:MAG: hypothetical protein OJF49_004078 [Ktedonobacterales bacterium]|jgi:hypothetical protein|nr:MAG: hypothetical protein OJF49_004078 [Ktedonobacterales bacterium]